MRNKKTIFLFLFLTAINSIPAQQGWWTWMHGNNTTVGGAGNYGTQGVAAATNQPPQLYKTDACWTDSNGKFWFYGGDVGLSALWKYDPVTNMWTWMKGPNTSGVPAVYGTKGVAAPANNPSPIGVGGALTWVDASNNLWLWGGTITTLASSADMWKYDQSTNMWTWMHGPGVANPPGIYGVQGVPSAANYPPPRYETSASWVDANGKFWMFGGDAAGGQINDMWKYDPVTNEWAWMHGPSTSGVAGNYGTKGVAAASNLPPFRWPYCRWTDNTGKFWMFGGTGVVTNTASYNDMWRFDPGTNQWTWVSGSNTINAMPPFPSKCTPSTTNYPQGRYENTVAWKDKCDNFWMYSGQWTSAQGSPHHSDVWCYKPQSNEWIFVNGNMAVSAGSLGVSAGSNWPGNTYGAAAFVYNNEFYMFGGRTAGPNANILWKYVPDSTCAKSFCNPPPVNPVAHFSADTLIGCVPLAVNFYNSSLNSTSWIWDFGDGSPVSNAQHPSHTYNSTGIYTVTLIASNGTISDTLVFTNYVIVLPQASVTISASDDTVCVGQTVSFTTNASNALGYFWILADSTGASITKGDTTATFIYTFTSSGVYTVHVNVDGQFKCDGSDSMNIYVLTGGSITNNAVICSGQLYTLPDGSQTGTTGTYKDTITFGAGCDSIITTILTVSPAGTFTQNPVICSGAVFTLPDGSTTAVGGTYVDTITTSGCDSIITTILSVVSSFTFTQSPVICAGNNFVLPDGSPATATGQYIDTIPSFGGCDSIITTNLTVNAAATGIQNPVLCAGNSFTLPDGTSVNTAGTYTDTVNAANGCDSVVTTTLNYKPNSVSAHSADICSDSSYTLFNGTVVTNSGVYVDTISSANGCDSVITVTLTVNPAPIVGVSADVSIIQGQSTILTATGGGNYNWLPSTGLNITTGASVNAAPDQTTIYCVEVINNFGCRDTACVTVNVEIPCPSPSDLAVPNAFSPNSDGVNDEFCLQGWDNCISNFNIRIYDRWGEKLFESDDPDFCWDGKYKGKIMDAQVCVYYLKASFLDQLKTIDKNGNISLIK